MTFERTEGVLAGVGQIPMSDTMAWRQAQRAGAQRAGQPALAVEAAQRAAGTAMPDRQPIVPGEAARPWAWPPLAEDGWPSLAED